jgi:tRNA A37 N6-isopentenylltransferase MiaA
MVIKKLASADTYRVIRGLEIFEADSKATTLLRGRPKKQREEVNK